MGDRWVATRFSFEGYDDRLRNSSRSVLFIIHRICDDGGRFGTFFLLGVQYLNNVFELNEGERLGAACNSNERCLRRATYRSSPMVWLLAKIIWYGLYKLQNRLAAGSVRHLHAEPRMLMNRTNHANKDVKTILESRLHAIPSQIVHYLSSRLHSFRK